MIFEPFHSTFLLHPCGYCDGYLRGVCFFVFLDLNTNFFYKNWFEFAIKSPILSFKNFFFLVILNQFLKLSIKKCKELVQRQYFSKRIDIITCDKNIQIVFITLFIDSIKFLKLKPIIITIL